MLLTKGHNNVHMHNPSCIARAAANLPGFTQTSLASLGPRPNFTAGAVATSLASLRLSLDYNVDGGVIADCRRRPVTGIRIETARATSTMAQTPADKPEGSDGRPGARASPSLRCPLAVVRLRLHSGWPEWPRAGPRFDFRVIRLHRSRSGMARLHPSLGLQPAGERGPASEVGLWRP